MTNAERLAELQARKTKADALGQQVIAQHQKLYDQICDVIYRLQLPDAPMEDLLAHLLDDVGQMTWPGGDYLSDCEKFFPRLLDDITALEKRLTGYINVSNTTAFVWYLPFYDRAWKVLNETANRQLDVKRSLAEIGAEPIELDYIPWID